MVASEGPVPVDRHSRYLDPQTIPPSRMPREAKYNLDTLTTTQVAGTEAYGKQERAKAVQRTNACYQKTPKRTQKRQKASGVNGKEHDPCPDYTAAKKTGGAETWEKSKMTSSDLNGAAS